MKDLIEALHDVDTDLIRHAVSIAERVKKEGKKVFFIGNGGSAAIASHMAIDWLKNGGFKAMAFNDAAYLTCISNDLGYENVFVKGIHTFGEHDDLLFAISSSGKSPSIIEAVDLANSMNLTTITLSGFRRDNMLRHMGGVNFYVNSSRYGVVEIAHLAIVHKILDAFTGNL